MKPQVPREYQFVAREIAPDTNWQQLFIERDQLNAATMERERVEQQLLQKAAAAQKEEKKEE